MWFYRSADIIISLSLIRHRSRADREQVAMVLPWCQSNASLYRLARRQTFSHATSKPAPFNETWGRREVVGAAKLSSNTRQEKHCEPCPEKVRACQ
jgi:hypothetical protein